MKPRRGGLNVGRGVQDQRIQGSWKAKEVEEEEELLICLHGTLIALPTVGARFIGRSNADHLCPISCNVAHLKTLTQHIKSFTNFLSSGDSWICAALILSVFVGFPKGAELNVDVGLRLDLACLQFRRELQDCLFEDFKSAVADPCIEVHVCTRCASHDSSHGWAQK
jgi:hypothetical protein